MEGSNRSEFSKTQEGQELKKYIFLAFLKQKTQSLKHAMDKEKAFNVFIAIVCALIFLLPLFRSIKYVNALLIIAGIVSVTRYAYLYVWIVGWIWEKPLGKLLLAASTPIVAAAAKIISDQRIRQLVQTNPSQLPTAQQALFVYSGLTIIIGILAVALLLRSMTIMLVEFSTSWAKNFLRMFDFFGIEEFIGSKKSKLNLRSFTESMSSMFAAALLLLALAEIDSLFEIKDRYNNKINLSEEIVLLSSFVENTGHVVYKEEKDGTLAKQNVKFCSNLEDDFYVSPVGNELVPTQVLTAEIRKNPSQKGRYKYQLKPCQNSNRLLEDRPLDNK